MNELQVFFNPFSLLRCAGALKRRYTVFVTTSPPTPRLHAAATSSLRTLLLCALVPSCLLLAACQQPLYDSRAPRSQYDRADMLRDTRPEQFVYNEYGTRKPNIRGRLLSQ